MKQIKFCLIVVFSLLTPCLYGEDEKANEAVIGMKRVHHLNIELKEEGVELELKTRRVKEGEIVTKKVGNVEERWIDGVKLSNNASYYNAVIITSFKLKIDEKEVHVPKNFWNDLTMYGLFEPVEGAENQVEDNGYNIMEDCRYRPQVSRSADGGTVLITWGIPEE